MENATKALLIAAAILILVSILSLLVMSYEQVSGYFKRDHENMVVEQLEKFNRQFDNYAHITIRGNEMLSMINKVVDYNIQQREYDGYDEIELIIYGINKNKDGIDIDNVIQQFKYEDTDSSMFINLDKRGTKAISEKVAELLGKLQTDIPGITESHLQTLSANIHYILATDEDDIKYRNKLLKNILNLDDIESQTDLLNDIKSVTKQYYQLTQFKRANFKCTKVEHSTKTGRVIKMEFEIVLNADESVKFE